MGYMCWGELFELGNHDDLYLVARDILYRVDRVSVCSLVIRSTDEFDATNPGGTQNWSKPRRVMLKKSNVGYSFDKGKTRVYLTKNEELFKRFDWDSDAFPLATFL